MPTKTVNTALIIPTFNAGNDDWQATLNAIQEQCIQPTYKLILDSGSSDETIKIAEQFGFEVYHVQSGEFDHASTRKWGIELVKDKADIVIFMTQDAVLTRKSSLKNLLNSFTDETIAIAYGRQLPRDHANPIEAFGRLFNYPEITETRTLKDKSRLGMKIAFCSDSYAAYRVAHILKNNAFPDRSIVGEDFIAAGNLLLSGFAVRYEASATVKHSHDYTLHQEFKRYFDIGVFHQEYASLIIQLGSTEKAGGSFVKAELSYLLEHSPELIPLAILRTACKYMGYKLGKHSSWLSNKRKQQLSLHPYYFK